MTKSKNSGGEPSGIVSRGGLAGLVLLALLAIPAMAQEGASVTGRTGINTDPSGRGAVDPSKNVLDTVSALKEMLKELRTTDKELSDVKAGRQDDLRIKGHAFQVAAREAADRRLADLFTAEQRRTNDLAQQKQLFDLELARILKAGVDEKSLLLATQLREVKTDLSERMSKQEQFRWESGGKSSVSDPAVVSLAADVRSMREAMKLNVGTDAGRGEIYAIIAAVLSLLGMLFMAGMAAFNAMRSHKGAQA